MQGSHFFYQTNGSEFIIRGVTYQPSNSSANEQADPLGNLAASVSDCMRDIPLLTQLTTNVIRVSYIDPTQDHTSCMDQLQQAGIYVLVDLPTNLTINSTDPTWNLDIYNSWTQRIDALAKFNNTLGFFAGNDIVTNSSNSAAAAFVKAAVRDLKAYMISSNYRKIPIGYEINATEYYDSVPLYMTCGGNASAAIDFLGISDFNLCSNNTSSSFETLTAFYGSYPAPVFLADYGCRDAAGEPRQFEEVQYIYGNNVTSGGIVYEYFPDDENYGNVPHHKPTVHADLGLRTCLHIRIFNYSIARFHLVLIPNRKDNATLDFLIQLYSHEHYHPQLPDRCFFLRFSNLATSCQPECLFMHDELSILRRHTRTRLRNRPISIPRPLWGGSRKLLSWCVCKRCYRYLWRIQHVQHQRTTFLGHELHLR